MSEEEQRRKRYRKYMLGWIKLYVIVGALIGILFFLLFKLIEWGVLN